MHPWVVSDVWCRIWTSMVQHACPHTRWSKARTDIAVVHTVDIAQREAAAQSAEQAAYWRQMSLACNWCDIGLQSIMFLHHIEMATPKCGRDRSHWVNIPMWSIKPAAGETACPIRHLAELAEAKHDMSKIMHWLKQNIEALTEAKRNMSKLNMRLPMHGHSKVTHHARHGTELQKNSYEEIWGCAGASHLPSSMGKLAIGALTSLWNSLRIGFPLQGCYQRASRW